MMRTESNDYYLCVPVTETLPATLRVIEDKILNMREELEEIRELMGDVKTDPAYLHSPLISDIDFVRGLKNMYQYCNSTDGDLQHMGFEIRKMNEKVNKDDD